MIVLGTNGHVLMLQLMAIYISYNTLEEMVVRGMKIRFTMQNLKTDLMFCNGQEKIVVQGNIIERAVMQQKMAIYILTLDML